MMSLLPSAAMRSSPAGARWLLIFVLFVFAAFISFEAGRLWVAAAYARSSDPADWERAAALEPGNAAHWQRLGRFHQWDFANTDLRRAITEYEHATQANPHSPYSWVELAGAYEMAGNVPRAREAFERAKAAHPISSQVAWNYGNFLLRAAKFPEAFAEIRRAISIDPSLAALAVSVCWRAGADVPRIFAEVVPPHAPAYLDALDFFVRQGDLNLAMDAWARLQNLREPIDLKRALPLVDELIRAGRAEDARRVWQQAVAEAHRNPTGPKGSLVWDGGFEEDFLRGGFGWRQADAPGVSVSFDQSAPHSGSRALLLAFDGTTNVDFGHVLQYIAVEPSTRYRVQAYFRLDDVSTDSGIHLRVFDLRNPQALDLSTPDLTGTLPWTLRELEFTTGPETRLLAITLRRAPSRKLDNKIHGSVWVDDVSLLPISPELAAGGRRAESQGPGKNSAP